MGKVGYQSSSHVEHQLNLSFSSGLTVVRYSSIYCELMQSRVIRRTLSSYAATWLVHSFVLSHLEYCHATSDYLSLLRIKYIQSVLNSGAVCLANLPRFFTNFKCFGL